MYDTKTLGRVPEKGRREKRAGKRERRRPDDSESTTVPAHPKMFFSHSL
jgi:hypothetical protein